MITERKEPTDSQIKNSPTKYTNMAVDRLLANSNHTGLLQRVTKIRIDDAMDVVRRSLEKIDRET